jgi:hypothetical protein
MSAEPGHYSTSLPADVSAALDAMPTALRAMFLAAVDQIEGPAHLYTIAHHLLRGDTDLAIYAAHANPASFARFDAVVALAFAIGATKG